MKLEIYLAIAGFFNALSCSFLFIIVLLKEGKTRLHKLLLWLCLSLIIYSIPYSLIFWPEGSSFNTKLLFYYLASIGLLFSAPILLHFITVFLHIEKKQKLFIFLSYLQAFLILPIVFTNYFIKGLAFKFSLILWAVPGIGWYIHILITSIITFYTLFLLFKFYRRSTGIKREQIKYILIGVFLGYTGAINNIFFWADINIPPYAHFLLSSYAIFSAYAVITHRLLDIKIVLRKSFVYLAALFSITSLYYPYKLILRIFSLENIFFDYIYIISILAIFPRLKTYYFKQANKHFFSSLYDSHEVISELDYKLRSTLDTNLICEYIYETLYEKLYFKNFGIFLYNREEKKYNAEYLKNLSININDFLPTDNALIKSYLKKNKTISIRQVKNKEYYRYKNSIDLLRNKNIEIIIPLNIKYKPIGLIVIGYKESGDIYNHEDYSLLEISSGLAAASLYNARLYREINEKNIYLQETLNIKTEFLRVINHQLNTPLSIMRMSLQSYYDKTIPLKKSLSTLRVGLDRMETTLSDFWLAYDIEGARVKIKEEKINVKILMKEILTEAKNIILRQKNKIKIAVNKPAFAMPTILVDYEKIKKVLLILLKNAIYYTAAGKITINYDKISEKNKNYLKITISDTGTGIKPEDINKLFDKFVRGHEATLFHPNGSGLGLYIAKHIIQSSGGKLILEESTVGKGSSFSVTLPIANV